MEAEVQELRRKISFEKVIFFKQKKIIKMCFDLIHVFLGSH